jgi:hypothetical protein
MDYFPLSSKEEIFWIEFSYFSSSQGNDRLLSLEQQVELSWIEFSHISSSHGSDGLLDII